MQTRMKRRLEAQVSVEVESQPLNFWKKQLRSKLPRRQRRQISPIIQNYSTISNNTLESRTVSEVSYDSSIASVHAKKPLRKSENEAGDECRRFTRSYYRNKVENESRKCDEVELQESSCVESSSGAVVFESSREKGLKLKSKNIQSEDSEAITKSEVSSVPQFSFLKEVKKNKNSVEITQDEATSKISSIQSFSGDLSTKVLSRGAEKSEVSLENDVVSFNSVENSIKINGNRTGKNDGVVSEVSANCCESGASKSILELAAPDINLACSEHFSSCSFLDGEEENQNSSDIFTETSDMEFEYSDDTQLFSFDSGSQFSEKSIEDESTSPMFQLFKQFKEQFCRSTFAVNCTSKTWENYDSHDTLLGLEQKEDEESYRMLRERERRQVYLFDYAEEYCSITDYGQLVIQQRLQMVHWIVEHATNKELQKETMFLGVNLLDRFLCKGYFTNKRNLQIVGIACLTLATRIEENQPSNCVRRKTFNVGSTAYGRCEVVAMEWLVQEVLNFQCFLPTYYNFLWFYLKAARANEQVKGTARYLAILALLGHQQLCFWPSTVAAGLAILASVATNQVASCRLLTESQAIRKDSDLPECIKSLEWLVKYIN
ncbi:cyclin-SDS [Olea europaea var. sylvestris]|uniref:cyclin-SDS n=1 Tax=Olea europaea var. sylvestris TaxID=158386 RepID=UPI000C1D76C0|nr:cyclin-SDS [Olea europaea var. sylvestris]